MFGLAEKIWNTWIESQEKAVLDKLFDTRVRPAEGEIESADGGRRNSV